MTPSTQSWGLHCAFCVFCLAAVPGAVSSYRLLGNQSEPIPAASPASGLVVQCGVTSVVASTTQASFLSSEPAIATYDVRLSHSDHVTCVDVGPVPAGAKEEPQGVLNLVTGMRDATCGVVLRLRYSSSAAGAPETARCVCTGS